MVVQHFSPEVFTRHMWPKQAQKIMSNLNLDSKTFSELVYTNTPIELGEVYLGYKRGKNQWKLFYILPKPIWEGEDVIWATFVRLFPPKHLYHQSDWRVTGGPTKMSVKELPPSENWMTGKIEKSYPEYISLTQLKELLKPIQFMNWMWERPISPKEEPKITKEEPKESWVNFANWLDNWEPSNK